MEIRGQTISYASYRAKTRREHETKLCKEIDNLEEQMTKEHNSEKKLKYMTLKKEIEGIHAEKVKVHS
jgi:hypothetical protein